MKYPSVLLAGLLGALVLALPAAAGEKTMVGWIEKVRIYPGNFLVHAKLDSGAEYSSLDAANLTQFDRDGQPWVRFDVIEGDGRKITIERPLLRNATIKRHYLQAQTRPVIKLGVCLGNLYKETEVNLVDRTGFNYRMLIGRKFMEGAVIIDPSAKYTVEPNCPNPAGLE
ncbi:MAG: RimK/LysX family protein [Desulfobaccales bacterium]